MVVEQGNCALDGCTFLLKRCTLIFGVGGGGYSFIGLSLEEDIEGVSNGKPCFC